MRLRCFDGLRMLFAAQVLVELLLPVKGERAHAAHVLRHTLAAVRTCENGRRKGGRGGGNLSVPRSTPVVSSSQVCKRPHRLCVSLCFAFRLGDSDSHPVAAMTSAAADSSGDGGIVSTLLRLRPRS